MFEFKQNIPKNNNEDENNLEIVIDLPEFKNTNEAFAFGENATNEQIKALEKRRNETIELIKQFSTQMDLKLLLSAKAQFDREAIETYEKNHSTKKAA